METSAGVHKTSSTSFKVETKDDIPRIPQFLTSEHSSMRFPSHLCTDPLSVTISQFSCWTYTVKNILYCDSVVHCQCGRHSMTHSSVCIAFRPNRTEAMERKATTQRQPHSGPYRFNDIASTTQYTYYRMSWEGDHKCRVQEDFERQCRDAWYEVEISVTSSANLSNLSC
jgi:hypothetical protein